MNLLKATGTIGGLTLVSRVLGMVRDMLMARFVGAGLASDAFLIAWRLPNLFRALFAEGAFAAVFVPLFNRTMAQADEAEPGSGLPAALVFAGHILSFLFPFLLLFLPPLNHSQTNSLLQRKNDCESDTCRSNRDSSFTTR